MNEFNIEDLESEEEWADGWVVVDNLMVTNYFNPKECLSLGVEAPEKYVNDSYKPVVCSLNNEINFIAVSTKTSQNKYSDAPCQLGTACGRRWRKGDFIGRAFVLEGQNHHGFTGAECWVCGHHLEASSMGCKLQKQRRVLKRTRSRTTTKEEEDNTKRAQRRKRAEEKKRKFTKGQMKDAGDCGDEGKKNEFVTALELKDAVENVELKNIIT